MIGKQDEPACWAINEFIRTVKKHRQEKDTDEPQKTVPSQNAVLVAGDSGNGKSHYVKLMSRSIDAQEFVILGSEIADAMASDNVDKLKNKVKEADKWSRQHGEMVAFRFEDLHEAPPEAEGFLKEILDKERYKKTITFMVTTNKFKKHSSELIRRFEARVVEMYNPTREQRRTFLKEYGEHEGVFLTEEQVEYIVNRTHDQSRSILKSIITILSADYNNSFNQQELESAVNISKRSCVKLKKIQDEQARDPNWFINNVTKGANIVIAGKVLYDVSAFMFPNVISPTAKGVWGYTGGMIFKGKATTTTN